MGLEMRVCNEYGCGGEVVEMFAGTEGISYCIDCRTQEPDEIDFECGKCDGRGCHACYGR